MVVRTIRTKMAGGATTSPMTQQRYRRHHYHHQLSERKEGRRRDDGEGWPRAHGSGRCGLPVRAVAAAGGDVEEKGGREGIASDGTVVPEAHMGLHEALYPRGAVAEHGGSGRATNAEKSDMVAAFAAGLFDTTEGAEVLPLSSAIDRIEHFMTERHVDKAAFCGTYGLYTTAGGGGLERLEFVGYSRNLLMCMKAHREAFRAFMGTEGAHGDGNERELLVRLRVWDKTKGMASRGKLEEEKQSWEAGANVRGEVFDDYLSHLAANGVDVDAGELNMKTMAQQLGVMQGAEKLEYEDKKSKLQKAMGENNHGPETVEEEDTRMREKMMKAAVSEDDWSAVIRDQTAETLDSGVVGPHEGDNARSSPFASEARRRAPGAGGEAGAVLAMTVEAVNEALDEVRPYLIADGGNVEVLSASDDGVVTLRLQGACGNCPSSSTTMKMGIERVLKERFGDKLVDVRQADETGAIIGAAAVTAEAIDAHLDTLRQAITNYGGDVRTLEVADGVAFIRYSGPDAILVGIKAAIRDKFPSIGEVNVRDCE